MFNQSTESYKKEFLNHSFQNHQQICGDLLVAPDHQQRIERIARKQTRGTSISWEDAAQAAHIKVLQAVESGKFRQGDIQKFYHWAMVVARFAIIDLVRQERRRKCDSLDQKLPGTDIALIETIQDEFNLLDIVEHADLLLRTIETVKELDLRYPHRQYLKLWQGKVEGKKQRQLAIDLNLTQGSVSKLWKELSRRVAMALGLLTIKTVQQETKSSLNQANRQRSTQLW